MIEPVRARYRERVRTGEPPMETWSQKRPVQSIRKGSRLRVIAGAPFTLRWSSVDEPDPHEAAGKATRLSVWFVDIPPPSSALRLTLSFADGLAIDASISVEP